MMSLRRSKLYQSIYDPSHAANDIWEQCFDYLSNKKDINIRDEETGGTILHALVENDGKFRSVVTIPAIYLMASSGLDLNVKDKEGNTCLHKVVRKKGAYRFMVALLRCGADPLIKNNAGQTIEDILKIEMPDGWKEMIHWYHKFNPGLYHAVQGDRADRDLIERLVKSWCRTSIIRDGVELNLKDVIHKSRTDLKQILEEYADTNEFAIGMLSGKGFLLKRWLDSGGETFVKVNLNTKDVSYQLSYEDYPEVPQPLLVAVWAMNDFEGVDVLMRLGADTSVLYTNENEDINPPKPVFFQLICGIPKPDDRIIQRILIESDMTARDLDGQTILFKAIETNQSDQFIQALFKYGADISQRDRNGRTVRDYAEYLRKTKYFHVIDDYVMQFVRNFDMKSLEKLIFSGYDHIVDLTDEKGINIMQAAIEKKTPPKELIDLLQKAKPLQAHMKKLLKAADSGSVPKVKSLISRKLAASQDKCGRTVLHRAVLARSRDLVEFLMDTYPHIMNIQENLGRTALHYMFLLMEGDGLADVMIVKGANKTIKDAAWKTPLDYQCERCGKKTFLTLKQELEGMSMDVYLARTNFEKNLRRAIRRGDIQKVTELIKGLQMSNGNINRFAKVLFDCLDYNQQDIALFFIQAGMRTDVYKEYKSRVLSLTDRAIGLNCNNVVQLLMDIKEGKVQTKPKVPKPAMPDFTVYGLV